MHRRLFLGTLAVTALGIPRWTYAQTTAVAADAAELAHAEIWKRFVDPRFDTLLHYAGLRGEVVLPSAEDCAARKPNGMSWSTPIEDGPFFGGLYLHGLCRRWMVRRDEESADKARRIAAGLLKLSALGATPGFVARGVGADGQAHYPASSEDQVFPWFFGLWSYLRSGLATEEERKRIAAALRSTVEAVEQNQWKVPCDPLEFGERGDFTRATAHDACRLLFLLKAMRELTGEERWDQQYRLRLEERIGKENRPRLEIAADGLHFEPVGKGETFVWTKAMSQGALRALADLETDEKIREALRRGLLASARNVAPHLARARNWDRGNTLTFEVDWRFLNESWKPQANCNEAIALARTQLPLWAAHNPRSPYKDDTVREPLFAAWVILLSGDAALRDEYRPEIQAMLARYEWSRLYTSTFFIAVNVFYEGL